MARQVNYIRPLKVKPIAPSLSPMGNYGFTNPYLLNPDDPYGIGARPTPTMQALRPPIPQQRIGRTTGINVRPAFQPPRYTPDFSRGIKPNFEVGKTQPNYSRFISDVAEMPMDLGTSVVESAPGRRSIGGKYADFVGQVGSLGNPSAKFAKTMAPFTQGGQAAAINQFMQSPKLGTAASAGLSYAFNANPYYATANAFMKALTGKSLDDSVNRLFNRRKKGQNVAQATEQANIANRMNQYSNEYMRMYGEQQAARREAEQNINEYRNQARNLSMFGPSARETAGLVASAMAPAQQAAAAAQANLAARGAEAGLSPASGVQMGGQVALQQGLAQAAGQVGSQISQDMQRRAFGMQDALAGMDAQQRNLATQTALQSLGAASELPMALERLRMAQQQADYARDEQMYQRRFGEQQMLAQGLGAFAPELFDLYKRNRGQQEADTGMIEDAGMLPESDFGQVGGRATYRDAQGILRYFDATDEDRATGRDIVLNRPNVSPAGLPTMPGGGIRPITTPDGRTVYQMADGTVFDQNGEMIYSPAGAAYESRFNQPVSQDTEMTLRVMNPGAREGEYAMNKPPQLANQEFRLVNGRWMKM